MAPMSLAAPRPQRRAKPKKEKNPERLCYAPGELR
jgi:hypothetical protein